jgi:general secretion pathway protein J
MTRAWKSLFRIVNGRGVAASRPKALGMVVTRSHPQAAIEAATLRNPQSARGGFTLAEVLVASTISGFVALIAVGALNAIASSAQTVSRTTETTSEIRFAARMVAHDLANLYRDVNPQNMKLVGSSQGTAKGEPPHLAFYMTGRAKARANQPEGDVYEVEYFLGTRERTRQAQKNEKGKATDLSEESTVLFRRLWPNPDKDRAPGGVLTPIAENIGAFLVRFFDGKQWADEWTEQMQSLPEYLEITLATLPPEKGDPIVETLTVVFPRLGNAAASPSQGGAPEGSQGQEGSAAPSATGPAPEPSGPQGGPGNSGSR